MGHIAAEDDKNTPSCVGPNVAPVATSIAIAEASKKLDPGNLSRSTKDYRGADKGEAAPLNKPLEISSCNEMENKGSSSRQQRFSSTATSNHRISETQAPAESSYGNSLYVNHALRLWTERWREWVGTRERPRPAERREPVISWSTSCEGLPGTNRPFTKPILLPYHHWAKLQEMVDFLVDVWEQEGLYGRLKVLVIKMSPLPSLLKQSKTICSVTVACSRGFVNDIANHSVDFKRISM